MANTISSNSTGLSIAEEATPGVLGGSPVWFGLEPNGYSDFGGNIVTVTRNPISATRQRKRGGVVDVEASGGFGQDFTKNNFRRLMQGFLFADAFEPFSTQGLNTAAIPITGATTTTYTAASGLGGVLANDIVLASGFGETANNGVKVASAATATAVTVTGNATEASPPAAAKLQVVGHQFASGDAEITVSGGIARLETTTKDLRQLKVKTGSWVFIGGDTSATSFATCPKGYARVASVAENEIVFDKVTAAFVSDAGASKTIQIFVGTFVQNQPVATDIKTRTYQLERTLGNDGNGVQSEYLIGSVANELSVAVPTTDKMTADLTFLSLDAETRDGTTGVKSGTRVAALGEAPINTSSNVYRSKLSILAPSTLQPTPLFGFINSATLTINNNCSVVKAVGNVGGIDINVGDFTVGGNIDAYFATVAAVDAVRANADVTYDLITAVDNGGVIFDIPLLGLGNARANVVKDQPINIPVEMEAAENAAGYTLGVCFFGYLPDGAMPSA